MSFMAASLDNRRHDLDADVADPDFEAPEGLERLRLACFHLLVLTSSPNSRARLPIGSDPRTPFVG